LPPGHLLRICCRTFRASTPERWWWPTPAVLSDLTFAAASDQLRSLFLESVALHLRSDVPLAAALSGGLDSSAVVCAMRRLQPSMPLHTFTFVAPGESIDETEWAQTVIRHVNAIPHRVEVNPDELAADLDEMIAAQGEPFGSTSIYAQYRVFKAAREAGMVVTLDGQGADELLAGYTGYPHARLRTMVSSGDIIGAARFITRWSQWPDRSLSQVPKVMAQGLLPEPVTSWVRQQHGNKTSPWLNRAWFARHGVNSRLQKGCPVEAADDLAGRHLMAALRQAQSISGLPALLRHADRNSMHWSLESRVPFLTTRLAEFLLSMPEHYLLSPQGETKHLFRAAMRGIVPDAILDRRDKVGFATPELRWLQQLKPVIPLWLSDTEALPFLDANAAIAQVQAVLSGQKSFSWQVWRLINFCRWFSLTQPLVS
jgi:asparagine synthase (glutamine-hydrolysing)